MYNLFPRYHYCLKKEKRINQSRQFSPVQKTFCLFKISSLSYKKYKKIHQRPILKNCYHHVNKKLVHPPNRSKKFYRWICNVGVKQRVEFTGAATSTRSRASRRSDRSSLPPVTDNALFQQQPRRSFIFKIVQLLRLNVNIDFRFKCQRNNIKKKCAAIIIQ